MRNINNGRYTFVSELGRGGMGVVWLAKDTMLGRDVAIKELMVPGGIPVDQRAEYQERVLREARIASRLANPGIVTIHDLITENGQMYIVMELVQAPTLTEWVERHGPMPVPRAAKLAEQVLGALEAAHDAGVVHRDVKPSNVMVPDKGTAKLADFGIAQSYDDTRITSTGMLIGSPAYMSPERLSSGDASPAWDLWALGATLYYAVEGHGAYERQTTTETILAVMTDRPRPQRCQGPMADLITGLLEHDLTRRINPAHAHQLIDRALHPAEDNTARMAPVPPPMGPPIPFQNSQPMPAYQPPTVVVQRYPRQSVVYHGDKRRPFGAIGVVVTLVALLAVGTVFVPKLISKLVDAASSAASNGGSSTPTSQKHKTSKAIQPVLTFGPGGDITSEYLTLAPENCFDWVPTKGKPGPKSSEEVGCYGLHNTESMMSGSLTSSEDDIPYPSADVLNATAGGGCADMLLSNKVDFDDKDNGLKVWPLVPSPQAWKLKIENGYRNETRYYACVVGKADGTPFNAPVFKM